MNISGIVADRRLWIAGCLAIGVALASNADAAEGDKAAAESAAKAFLQQLEDGDLGTAYDQRVGNAMKALMDRQTFIQQMGLVRVQSGGSAQVRVLVGSQELNRLPTGQAGSFYFVRFKSRFPTALVFQDVTLENIGGRWLVIGVYNLPAPPD